MNYGDLGRAVTLNQQFMCDDKAYDGYRINSTSSISPFPQPNLANQEPKTNSDNLKRLSFHRRWVLLTSISLINTPGYDSIKTKYRS